MCGIAGVYALGDTAPDPEWGALLVKSLRHRGPDGEGVYADRRVVLAHTRLAIIDLSDAGGQPMRSADNRHVLVMNGEIYNHADLRAELESHGTSLRSRSDTEALLESLVRCGPQALSRARGMWAFAFYDRERGDLLLARDRLGKKPLYWLRTDDFLAFASEAQALLKLPFVQPRIDRRFVRDYVSLLYTPGPHTLIEGLHKLDAASTLTVSGAEPRASIQPERYWSLPEPEPEQGTDSEWWSTLEDELLEATRLRTVSDVPIGVFLSGGLDSNLVLERLRAVGHRPVRAFTVGFAGMPDERPLARIGARANADEHQELVVETDLARELPEILSHFGDPLGDSAVVTTYLISREASRHVKVILNGDGGDELFGGYSRYPFAFRAEVAARMPAMLPVLARRYRNRPALEPVFAALAARRAGTAARGLGSVTTAAQADALLAPDLPASQETRPANQHGLVAAMFDWDTHVYLPDDLLYKADCAAMAHALENRSPLLDHRLFEHVARLVPTRRVHPYETKPLMRRMVGRRLPPALLQAPKQGFQLPLESWLQGPLRGWLDGLLLDPQATGPLYRPGALRAAVESFHAGKGDEVAPHRLWGLAALETWARTFHVAIED